MDITGATLSPSWMVKFYKMCPLWGLYGLFLLRLEVCCDAQWLLTLEDDSIQHSLAGEMEESERCH